MPTSNREIKVGTKVIIEVDSVNSPTGLFKGEVISCVEKSGNKEYYSHVIEAKITDGAHSGTIPTVNYEIYELTEDFDRFFKRSQNTISKLHHENDLLRNQIYTLRSVFKDIGSGINENIAKLIKPFIKQ